MANSCTLAADGYNNGANFSGCNFQGKDLSEAALIEANLAGANLSKAILASVNMIYMTTTDTTICPDGSKGPCKF